MAEFCLSSRGQRKLLFNGYVYEKMRETTTTTHWQCERRSQRCKGRVCTALGAERGAEVTVNNEHCHEADMARVDKLKAIDRLKHLATGTHVAYFS